MPLRKQQERVRRADEQRLVEQAPGETQLGCWQGAWGCLGPRNYLWKKPTHKNKWEQESCQLIKMACSRKY